MVKCQSKGGDREAREKIQAIYDLLDNTAVRLRIE